MVEVLRSRSLPGSTCPAGPGTRMHVGMRAGRLDGPAAAEGPRARARVGAVTAVTLQQPGGPQRGSCSGNALSAHHAHHLPQPSRCRRDTSPRHRDVLLALTHAWLPASWM